MVGTYHLQTKISTRCGVSNLHELHSTVEPELVFFKNVGVILEIIIIVVFDRGGGILSAIKKKKEDANIHLSISLAIYSKYSLFIVSCQLTTDRVKN